MNEEVYKGNNNDDTEKEIVGCRKAISRALHCWNQLHLLLCISFGTKSSKLLKFTTSGKWGVTVETGISSDMTEGRKA